MDFRFSPLQTLLFLVLIYRWYVLGALLLGDTIIWFLRGL